MNKVVRELLVAYDGSDAAQRAMHWAVKEASSLGGKKLTLITSYEIPASVYASGVALPDNFAEDVAEGADNLLTKAVQEIKKLAPEITVEKILQHGSIVDVLLAEAEAREDSWIVMGSRGRNGISSVVLGSNSAAVVSRAPKPVVVVREDHEIENNKPTDKVIVGIDESENSKPALIEALKVAESKGVELDIMNSWFDPQVEAVQLYVGSKYIGLSQDEVAERKKKLTADLAPILAEFPKVKYNIVLMQDRPAVALAEAAKAAQLLVVGSRGRGGFKGMLLGSTSLRLLHDSPCPLMVVHPTN